MTMTTLTINAVLAATLYLLVTEKLPIGLTGIGLMVILPLTGLMSPEEAVLGIAHPAVVTVAAMFVVSKGMVRTGAVEFIGKQIILYSRGNIYISLGLILITVAITSAFINNTPIVILFIPVVMRMCCEFDYSPSQFLIPVSYASIFAGTCTLIGTSTNIIISDLSASHGFGALSMFELAPVGVPIAIVGIGLLIVFSIKVMPSLKNPICQLQDSDHRRYIAEIMICALGAAILMIISGCLQMRDAYKALQADVLLLIAGTIALGAAMEKTGTSKLYAETFLTFFQGASPRIILGGIVCLTSVSTQLLSNSATAVLLFPIAVSTAVSIGVDPKPFIVGLCFGASASFATPIGYQTNLLVYGPGGYRFSDYLKLGIPLNIFVIVAGSLVIPMIWPF